MDHSAFDSRSFLLSAGGRTVFYTGDFRAHGRKWQLFHRLPAKLPRKIDVLLMEGTHVGNPRGPLRTETDIKNKIQATGMKYSGLKFVYTSGQNIDRLVSFYKAARHSGKALVLDLYTAFILDSLKYPGIPHPSRRFPEIKVLYSKPYMKRLAMAGLKDAWDKYRPYQVWPRQIARKPGDYFLMYRPGVIKEIEEIGSFKDSVLIYSLYSGYRTEKSYAKVLAFLQKYGISETIIHTSGHAYPKHLWLLANKLNPGVLIPVHTFDPEGFKSIYPNVKVLQDGESFDIR
jgi:ribonuclease J